MRLVFSEYLRDEKINPLWFSGARHDPATNHVELDYVLDSPIGVTLEVTEVLPEYSLYDGKELKYHCLKVVGINGARSIVWNEDSANNGWQNYLTVGRELIDSEIISTYNESEKIWELISKDSCYSRLRDSGRFIIQPLESNFNGRYVTVKYLARSEEKAQDTFYLTYGYDRVDGILSLITLTREIVSPTYNEELKQQFLTAQGV